MKRTPAAKIVVLVDQQVDGTVTARFKLNDAQEVGIEAAILKQVAGHIQIDNKLAEQLNGKGLGDASLTHTARSLHTYLTQCAEPHLHGLLAQLSAQARRVIYTLMHSRANLSLHQLEEGTPTDLRLALEEICGHVKRRGGRIKKELQSE